MKKHRLLTAALCLNLLIDALIVLTITLKAFMHGLRGLRGWFLHIHLVPVSASDGEATYKLQADYSFAAFYLAVIAGAVALTFFLLRMRAMDRHDT